MSFLVLNRHTWCIPLRGQLQAPFWRVWWNQPEIATVKIKKTDSRNVYVHFPCDADIIVFYSFFKTLVDQEVTVELKNDLAIKGILKSVDQFLNIKLDDITVLEENKYPHLVQPDQR